MGHLVAGPDYGGFSRRRQLGPWASAVCGRHRVKSRTSVVVPLTRTKRVDIRLFPVVVVHRPGARCLWSGARGFDYRRAPVAAGDSVSVCDRGSGRVNREGTKDSMNVVPRLLRWIVLGVAALLAACVTPGGGEPAPVPEKPAASVGNSDDRDDPIEGFNRAVYTI